MQAGKLQQKGKPYEMQDGDIAHWKRTSCLFPILSGA